MSARPLISVVLPTFNRASTLPRAIQSVLTQTWCELELIVVDDGSTDATEALVNQIATIDTRVRFVRRAQNGGAAAARNTGLAEACGELVAFQDSDDEWLPHKLARQVAALREAGEKCAMCVCSYLVHRAHDPVRGFFLGAVNLVYPDDLRRQTLVNFFFPTPSWLARTHVLREAGGFNESMRCWEDWELAVSVGDRNEIALVDEPLMIQHVSSGSVNRQDAAYGPALRCILDRHAARMATEPHFLAEHLYVLGRHEIRYGSVEQARTYFDEAAKLRPRFRTARIAWLASKLGAMRWHDAFRRWRMSKQQHGVPKATVLDYIIRTHGAGLLREG